ncbi:MAG: Fur family transcriptional regulator [Thermincolia bacterium]
MQQTFDEICSKLAENEYKVTPQRKIILKAFLDNGDGHLSAEDVYGIVKVQHPEIGLATVYRTLELLAELNILQKMNFGDGRSRFEFSETDAHHHHHHLICVNCGQVTEFDDDLLESLETAISKKSEFKIIDHQLKFYGYCRKCQ